MITFLGLDKGVLLRYVLTYAPDLTNNEARNSNYVLTLIVNEVLSLLMNGLYEAF